MNKTRAINAVVFIVSFILFVIFGLPILNDCVNNYKEYNKNIQKVKELNAEIDDIGKQIESVKNERKQSSSNLDVSDSIATVNYICALDGVSFDTLYAYKLNSINEVELVATITSIADVQQLNSKCKMLELRIKAENTIETTEVLESLPLDYVDYTIVVPDNLIIIRALFI